MERKRYLEIDYLRVLSMFGVFLIHRMKYVSEKCEYFDWLLILGLSLAGAWLLTEISNQIVKRSNVKWMDS